MKGSKGDDGDDGMMGDPGYPGKPGFKVRRWCDQVYSVIDWYIHMCIGRTWTKRTTWRTRTRWNERSSWRRCMCVIVHSYSLCN